MVHQLASIAVIVLGISMPVVAADAPPATTSPGFTDITAASGIAEIVAQHYGDVPKWWLSGLTLADLDGDGDLDLHLANHGLLPAAAAANDGHGHFTRVDPIMTAARGPRAKADLPYGGGEIRLCYDLDEDGRLDLLCSWHDGGGALYMNDTKPTAAAGATPAGVSAPGADGAKPVAWNFRRSEALDPFSRATAIVDLNRDGIVDYLADERSDIRVLTGKAGGQFGGKPIVIPGLKESGAIPADLNGDGRIDLLVSQRGYNPAGRRVLINDTKADGDLHFTDATKEAGLDPAAGSIHGVADVNADGAPDLICIEGSGRDAHIEIYLNDGKARFTRKEGAVRGMDKTRRHPESTNWGGAVLTDFDNDGIPDLIVNGRHFLYVLRGVGGGTFELANDAWHVPMDDWSAVDEGLCFGDIDNDGRLDLITCGPGADGKEKGIRVLHNDLPRDAAHHWLRIRPIGKPGNRAATGAVIRLYEPATEKLIASEQVSIWGRQSFHSYYAATVTERHFGLGPREAVDVSVEFYPSGKKVTKRGVKADGVVEVLEAE